MSDDQKTFFPWPCGGRYRPLRPCRVVRPLSIAATQLHLSAGCAVRTLDEVLHAVDASNARLDSVERLRGYLFRAERPPVSIEQMNAAIAECGAGFQAVNGDHDPSPVLNSAVEGLPSHEGAPRPDEERTWLDMPDVGAEMLKDDRRTVQEHTRPLKPRRRWNTSRKQKLTTRSDSISYGLGRSGARRGVMQSCVHARSRRGRWIR